MARIFNPGTQVEQKARTWLSAILEAGGLRSPSGNYSFSGNFVSAATAMCNELVNRDFVDVDSSLRTISNYKLYVANRRTSFSPEELAKCLVYMAELTQLYWDDEIRTPYEIDEFKKTLLGAAVYKYGRYISAIKDSSSSNKSSSKTSAGSNSGANKQPPKNNYKQSGGQSGNVRDLIGKPGEKVQADTATSYKIIGDMVGQSIPNVFIKPLNPKGAAGSTNKVFVGTGKGYGECTCFFDDPNDANDFLNKVLNSGKVEIPQQVTNLHVVKVKSDKNGYFLVGTELGLCAISAQKLNEALQEEATASTERPCSWEKATEGYSQEELEELHTWMRRD